uniref:ABC-type nitrate/sulfonate/bicarbonate transport system, substrate-binding protein n=1 Tax=Candidatus Kentrum sp. DK TaxID=2126562 RepID=A0A450S8C8_9GAMM|nr:MAG: ABC-type nitrate/sulfonate/bicarbonate transport system, substrate-binding protein [Candidatus Kentron sp. DK]
MKKGNTIIGAILLIAVAFTLILWKTQTPDNEVRKYAYIPSTLVDAPSTVGVDLLREKGIKPISFVTGRETVQALTGGAAFVATLAEWPFLLASSNRDDLRVIAVITSAQSMGILADRSAGVESARDLIGKRVGFPQGTSAQFLFESYFNSAGTLKKVTPVNLPPPQLQPALARGDIQAMAIWQPFLERARMERPDDFFYLPESRTAFRVVYCVVSTQENIKRDPEGIKRVLEALIEAEGVLANRTPAALDKLRSATNLDSETLNTLLPLFRYQVVLDNEIINTWKRLAVWAHASGLAPEDVLERNWRNYIHSETLQELAPERVRF